MAELHINCPQGVEIQNDNIANFEYKAGNKSFKLIGEVKYRGGSTIRFSKKSYAVELSESISMADLPADDDWVLNASYVDKTFMRHKLGYDLFMRMGHENKAPLSSYLQVYENEDYRGIFVVKQKLTQKVLGVQSDGLIFKEPPIFYAGEMSYQDENNHFQQQFPKLFQVDKKDILLNFRKFLFESNPVDFAQNIRNWIDLDNVVDWYILLLLANAGDNINKNFYLYKTNEASPFKVALWDFDHSFGRDGDNELNLMERPLGLHKSILFQRLRYNPHLGFNSLVEERWKNLRKEGVITLDYFEMTIDAMHTKLEPYISKNESRWPVDAVDYFDSNDYGQEVIILQNFIRSRVKELDRVFCY